MGTTFDNIPYPFSPMFGENEFRGSARQSRISLLVEGALGPSQKLSGYYEMDFLGVGVTSNYNQSNSWAPRLRQGFFAYDNTDWGFHFLAGQAWSLLTQNTVGITARKENIPLTIDANYVGGFDYTRNWQLRVVQDWGTWAAFGLSVEAPAELVYGGAGASPAADRQSLRRPVRVAAQRIAVNFQIGHGWPPQGSSAAAPSAIPSPPMSLRTSSRKAAFDPGWGHYEVFGIQRFFNDNTFNCSVAERPPAGRRVGSATPRGVANGVAGTQRQQTKTGEGIGGSVLLPIFRSTSTIQASTLYGSGIGRYGASTIVRCRRRARWFLVPITALHAHGRPRCASLGRARRLRLRWNRKGE